ncbi:MAG: MarR family transcriptional regulator [Clostridiales bacterium]|nr:MarR family transcriptional regulator [Clostridiales bacterium]
MKGRDHGHGSCRHCQESTPDRGDLAGKFEQCGRLLSHCLGKRRGQGRILRTLCQRGEMPQKELQDLLGIQAGSMSEIAAKLEDKGLIVRVRSEEDRRKVSLSITERGRAWVAQRDEEHILRRRAELFSSLTPEEQKLLESLLDKLSSDWVQRLERRGDGEEGRGR